MNDKNPTKKKRLDSENIDTYKNVNNLNGSTDNNYDVDNQIINEENKQLYGNNSNLYSKEYVPSKNDVDNITGYENKKFNTNETTTSYNNNLNNYSNDVSMDSVLRDSINNSTNKENPSGTKNSKKWAYNSDKNGMY